MNDSRSYAGKVRLGFALFFGASAWLFVLFALATELGRILHPAGIGGPLHSGIVLPIAICAATLLAAPGAIICALRPAWLTTFYPRCWRTAAILCYGLVLPGLLLIGGFSIYACWH